MVVAGDEPQGLFSLGSLESTAAVRIPSTLAHFNQRYPKIHLALSTGPSGTMIDGVLEGALSAAFVDGPLVHPGLEGLPVFPEEMMIVAPYGHAPITRASEVNGANVYAFRANCSYRRHFESWFHADRATPGRIHEMESYHGMLACVIAGAGLALIPRSMLESMPGHQQVSAWPLAEEWRWLTTWLVWRRGAKTRQLEAFKIGKQWFLHKHAERIGLIRRKRAAGLVAVARVEGDGRMLMDTGLQAQGMAVALTRFRFQRRQQLFSQLLAAVLGIDIHPLHIAKAFLTEDNSPAANGLALRAADRQGDDRLRRQLAKVQQVVALRRVEGLLPGVEGGNQGDKFGVGRGDVGDGVHR